MLGVPKNSYEFVEKVQCRSCRNGQYSMDAVHFFPRGQSKYAENWNKILTLEFQFLKMKIY